jgi:hypothetical protein
MAGEMDEPTPEPRGPFPTLLSELPPTDPAILKAFEDKWARDRHYAAIGGVAATWAYFEAIIDTWLVAFADVDAAVGVCFTAQMIGPRPRIDALIALVRYLGIAQRWNKRLEQFAKDAQGLAELRNRAVHDVWDMTEPTRPIRQEATARRALRIVQIHVPTQELFSLAQNIETLRARFEEEIASPMFDALLRASRDRPSP